MSESEFSCEQCDQNFSGEYELRWHILKQHSYWCYKCPATFYTKNSNYSRVQWMHHMIEEHIMNELSEKILNEMVIKMTQRKDMDQDDMEK